jgi:hypothetical protein
MDIAGAAATADAVVKDLQKYEPLVAGAASFIIPGGQPFVALAQPMIATGLMYLDRALADIATDNGGDIGAGFIELINHLMKGGPNSPTLSSGTSSAPVVAATNAALATTTAQAINFQAPTGN